MATGAAELLELVTVAAVALGPAVMSTVTWLLLEAWPLMENWSVAVPKFWRLLKAEPVREV